MNCLSLFPPLSLSPSLPPFLFLFFTVRPPSIQISVLLNWLLRGHKTFSYTTALFGVTLAVGAFQMVQENWYEKCILVYSFAERLVSDCLFADVFQCTDGPSLWA